MGGGGGELQKLSSVMGFIRGVSEAVMDRLHCYGNRESSAQGGGEAQDLGPIRKTSQDTHTHTHTHTHTNTHTQYIHLSPNPSLSLCTHSVTLFIIWLHSISHWVTVSFGLFDSVLLYSLSTVRSPSLSVSFSVSFPFSWTGSSRQSLCLSFDLSLSFCVSSYCVLSPQHTLSVRPCPFLWVNLISSPRSFGHYLSTSLSVGMSIHITVCWSDLFSSLSVGLLACLFSSLSVGLSVCSSLFFFQLSDSSIARTCHLDLLLPPSSNPVFFSHSPPPLLRTTICSAFRCSLCSCSPPFLYPLCVTRSHTHTNTHTFHGEGVLFRIISAASNEVHLTPAVSQGLGVQRSEAPLQENGECAAWESSWRGSWAREGEWGGEGRRAPAEQSAAQSTVAGPRSDGTPPSPRTGAAISFKSQRAPQL